MLLQDHDCQRIIGVIGTQVQDRRCRKVYAPKLCKNFKKLQKHKLKEMSVEDMVVRLRIEEDKQLAQKDSYTPDSAKANMVEHAGSSSRFNSKGNKKDKKKNDKKGKGKSEYLAPKAGIVKQKFQGTCYNCDQPGHRAANCKMPKRVNPRQANMVDDEMLDRFAMVQTRCAMTTEVTCRAFDNGQMLFIGPTLQLCKSRGEGDVILKMTSEKELKLTNCLGTGSSSRLDDKVVQDKRQRNDNDLQDERQDQTDEEEVEPRRSKRARNEKYDTTRFVSYMVVK
ncbi:zinc finger, CCHC-type containing protein [Tanacetum coccineum]